MKEYDLICIGTGSAMAVVEAMISENPKAKIAVIDKDNPGGICLNADVIDAGPLVDIAGIDPETEVEVRYTIRACR